MRNHRDEDDDKPLPPNYSLQLWLILAAVGVCAIVLLVIMGFILSPPRLR